MKRTRQNIETSDYILNFKDLTCYIKETKQTTNANIEILEELSRSYWREEKRNHKYNYMITSYENLVSTGIELLYFLSNPINKNPLNDIIHKEQKVKIKELFLSLPKKPRNILWKYYYENKNEIEIAKEMNLNKKIVHYYKKKYIQKIRQERNYEEFL